MSQPIDLLVVGDCNPDIVVSGTDVEPAFGQQEKLVAGAEMVLGGSGAITAVQAAKLGVTTAFVGSVGDDELGRWVLGELAGAGVIVDACLVDPGTRTGMTVVFSRSGTSDGDRGMLTYRGAIDRLEASRVRIDLVRSARHVHFAALYLHPALLKGLPALASAAVREGAKVSADPNWDPSGRWADVLPVLGSIGILMANEAEVSAIGRALGDVACGCGEGPPPARSPGPAEAAETASVLSERGQTVVMKRGARGAFLVSGPLSRSVSCDLPAGSTVVDTTGAGDSFDAGFLAGRLAGLPDSDSLYLGCYCGMRTVTAVGGTAAQPTASDVLRDIGLRL